jgi:hypothetical protein
VSAKPEEDVMRCMGGGRGVTRPTRGDGGFPGPIPRSAVPSDPILQHNGMVIIDSDAGVRS